MLTANQVSFSRSALFSFEGMGRMAPNYSCAKDHIRHCFAFTIFSDKGWVMLLVRPGMASIRKGVGQSGLNSPDTVKIY